MPALVTADLHLSDNPRDEYRFKAMRTIRQIMKKRDVDLLIVLGDICESKNHHSAELVNAVVDEFAKFAKLAPVIVTKANHDYEKEDAPFWAFLRRIPNITYVGAPTDEKTLPNPPHPSLGRVLFLPHTPNFKRDWEKLKLEDYDVIFAHQTFKGAVNESGHEMDGVPLDIFSPWTRIIAGDIHAPQTIGQLTYVGAPSIIDFGNDYEPRVLLMDGKKTESIPVPGPQKRLIDTKDFESAKAAIKKLAAGDLVKVRLPFNPGGEHSWQEIKDEIRAWCEQHGLQLEKVEPILDKSKTRKVRERSPKSDKELLTAYAKSRRIDEQRLKTGHWLLEKS